jgi:hypothetical protein
VKSFLFCHAPVIFAGFQSVPPATQRGTAPSARLWQHSRCAASRKITSRTRAPDLADRDSGPAANTTGAWFAGVLRLGAQPPHTAALPPSPASGAAFFSRPSDPSRWSPRRRIRQTCSRSSDHRCRQVASRRGLPRRAQISRGGNFSDGQKMYARQWPDRRSVRRVKKVLLLYLFYVPEEMDHWGAGAPHASAATLTALRHDLRVYSLPRQNTIRPAKPRGRTNL